jgi:hypothetical protein
MKILKLAVMSVAFCFYVFLSGCATVNTNLSTPEATINHLYNSYSYGSLEGINECMEKERVKALKTHLDWFQFRVRKAVKYDGAAVKSFIDSHLNIKDWKYDAAVMPQEGDVEIPVKEASINGKSQDLCVIYLLRKFKDEWLVISHITSSDSYTVVEKKKKKK